MKVKGGGEDRASAVKLHIVTNLPLQHICTDEGIGVVLRINW